MRQSPLIKVMNGGKLVGLEIIQPTATMPAPNAFELEVVRIFNEHKQLEEQFTALQKAYTQYTTGEGYEYHDVHCNADRRKPMGCAGCSCVIGHELQGLRTDNERLRKGLHALTLSRDAYYKLHPAQKGGQETPT